jgi:hypothetical protein
MKRLLFAVAIISLAISGLNAQKFKPAPNFLKDQAEINVVFDYSKTTFDGDSQQKQYKDKGTKWVEEWEGKRRDGNANAFTTSINEEFQKLDVNIDEHPNAQYTLIVEVLDCDFGAFAGPFSVPAKLKCTVKVVKTGTTEVLASITLKESQNPYSVVGTPVDFDRMYLAFSEMGEEVGEKLVKALKQ